MSVRLVTEPESPHFGTVEVVGIPSQRIASLKNRSSQDEAWGEVLAIYTGAELPPPESDKPAVAGTYLVEGHRLRFTPRYPLVTGLVYSARLYLGSEKVHSTFMLAAVKKTPSTSVVEIYPTSDVLPENLLRLYLHFSAPMSRGSAYENVRVVHEASGEDVLAPFVEIEQELWDSEMRRLTLLFDPGRIKRGLVPNAEMGPPLAAGNSYRLLVDAGWQDGRGIPLKEGYERRFRIVSADRASPRPADWEVIAPQPESRDPVELTFPEPLDHGLLMRVLTVRDRRGNPVAGRVDVSRKETRWSFSPETAWSRGDYEIEVETILEDLAGNNLKSVFDVDLKKITEKRIEEDKIHIAFSVSGDT